MPRFQAAAFRQQLALLDELRAVAHEHGCDARAALARLGVAEESRSIVPIIGTTNIAHLEEDLAAANVKLTPELTRRLEALINQQTVSGPRYPSETQKEIDTEEFA